MDDDGLLHIDRSKHPSQNRSLGLSGSESHFYKQKPFSLRNSTSGAGRMSASVDESRITSGYQNLQTTPPYDPLDKWTNWGSTQHLSRSRMSEDGRDLADSSSVTGYLSDRNSKKYRARNRSSNNRRRHFSSTGYLVPTGNIRWEPSNDQGGYQQYASFGIGFLSQVGETFMSHPCIVLRRQCQVRSDSPYYHLTPFTLLPVAYNFYRFQGAACLWKGIGSVFVLRGLHVVTENLISEATNWPKEVSRHSSTKKVAQNLCLKAVTCAVLAPFYAASLVETVQSDIASDSPGVLDCLKDGASRYLVLTASASSSNLLPFWKLLPPVVITGVCGYAIRCLASYVVVRSNESEAPAVGRRSRIGDLANRNQSHRLYNSVYTQLFSGFVASLLSDILLYPVETLAHRLCLQGTPALIDNTDTGVGIVSIGTGYTGVFDAVLTAWREETPFGLYKGFGALVLQFGAHLCLLRLVRLSCERLAAAWPSESKRVKQTEACDTESTVSHSSPFSDGEESPAADSC